jgi:hypothetical protein
MHPAASAPGGSGEKMSLVLPHVPRDVPCRSYLAAKATLVG